MPFLYKYLPPERDSYFSDALLRFTPPAALNDSFECVPGFNKEFEKMAIQFFEKLLMGVPYWNLALPINERIILKREFQTIARQLINRFKKDPMLYMDSIYDRAAEKINKNLGVLSLSKRWDSALMWSHYANSHHGFCIGFNKEHEFFSDFSVKAKSGNFTVMPVSYSDKRPNLPIEGKLNRSEIIKILHTKSSDWEYEQEVRAISDLKYATKVVQMEPFDLSLFQVPHDAIGEIIIGLRTDKKVCQKAFDISRKLSVPLFFTQISNQSFDLDRKQIAL